MGGSSSNLISSVTNPIGYVQDELIEKAGGGKDFTTNPTGTATKELVEKPKAMQKEIEREIQAQEEAARKAEEEYQKDQSAAKKEARDVALRNLERSQARLKSQQPTQKGGYGGTILTSPLGLSGSDTNGNAAQKTLLGQ